MPVTAHITHAWVVKFGAHLTTKMNIQRSSFVKVLSLLAFSLLWVHPLSAQEAQASNEHKGPQLKLEVVPLKKTYLVGETVFVKYKLTSLVDGTLCFPEPAAEQTGRAGGYLKTDATLPKAMDVELFIDDVWPRHPTDEELRQDVVNRWVKLGMSEPHKLKKSGRVTVLTGPGEWVLRSTYHPPELSAHEKTIVESLGCTPPDSEIYSAAVTMTVLTPPQ